MRHPVRKTAAGAPAEQEGGSTGARQWLGSMCGPRHWVDNNCSARQRRVDNWHRFDRNGSGARVDGAGAADHGVRSDGAGGLGGRAINTHTYDRE